ncbi:MAG TPA: alpha/beta fold hydrolase [Humisphaera sp.]
MVLRDGCHLAWRSAGSGPAVLMIQGVGVHGGGWRPQVDALAGRYRCVTFDNRGMGGSQPVGTGPLTVGRMADDVAAVMDAAGVDSAHVLGHSLGGLVALQLALSHRSRVRSLALLCTFADGRIPTRLTPWMMWAGLRTRIGPRRARRRAFLRFVLTPAELAAADADAVAAELAPLFGHDLADQPAVAMPQLRAMGRCDLTPRLGELAGVPTRVVSAAHDRIAPPAAGRAIAAGVPGARFDCVDDAAHGLPITHAGRVNEMLEGHWAAVG